MRKISILLLLPFLISACRAATTAIPSISTNTPQDTPIEVIPTEGPAFRQPKNLKDPLIQKNHEATHETQLSGNIHSANCSPLMEYALFMTRNLHLLQQLKGIDLFLLPSQLTTWASWKGEHPNTLVRINDLVLLSFNRVRFDSDFVAQDNYDEFTPQKFSAWMRFESSPQLGTKGPDSPLWELDGLKLP